MVLCVAHDRTVFTAPMWPVTNCIFFFLCGMHHQGCVVPNADISLQSGRFWATVIASSWERLLDLRSCWIVFIHVVRWRPGGLLQFYEGEAVMLLLASVSSGILAMWPNRELTVWQKNTLYGSTTYVFQNFLHYFRQLLDMKLEPFTQVSRNTLGSAAHCTTFYTPHYYACFHWS